jgi:hypothetical protein
MFAVFVQDVNEYAIALHGRASATAAQQSASLGLVRHPVVNEEAARALHEEILRAANRVGTQTEAPARRRA